MKGSPLGREVAYPERYCPELLFPIPRSCTRDRLALEGPLPFHGVDIWNAYELSWLEPGGKPKIATAELRIPAESPCLIESKSLKLYLNSLNQTTFSSQKELEETLASDLGRGCGAAVGLRLFDERSSPLPEPLGGFCLDSLEVETSRYEVDPSLLGADEAARCSETLYSHLFRSNCPCTGQPDWASLSISYRGPAIDKEGLLKYLISYRSHQAFHEDCVEKLFLDLLQRCRPEKLSVRAFFTRRGGLDINPFRSNFEEPPPPKRLFRQ